MPKIAHADLMKLLHYDPATGLFTWRVAASARVPKGSVAGTINSLGYRVITIDGCKFHAHRLAWFYVHGTWPRQIDHRNGHRADNRIANLREATSSQKSANAKKHKHGLVKLKGVRCFFNRGLHKPFQAQIRVNGKTVSLGYFITAERAHAAYVVAAKKYFGEFARAA